MSSLLTFYNQKEVEEFVNGTGHSVNAVGNYMSVAVTSGGKRLVWRGLKVDGSDEANWDLIKLILHRLGKKADKDYFFGGKHEFIDIATLPPNIAYGEQLTMGIE